MKNIKLTISYDGTGYLGWQRLHGERRCRSIQGLLEEVLEQVMGVSIRVHGSGRTDAGVHAKGQVANFKVPSSFFLNRISYGGGKGNLRIPVGRRLVVRSTVRVRRKRTGMVLQFLWMRQGRLFWFGRELVKEINDRLPDAICVREAQLVSHKFHSRYSVKRKTYSYAIDLREPPSVFSRKYALSVTETLDLSAMQTAAGKFVGTYDFSGFCSKNPGREKAGRTKKNQNVRTIYDCRVERKQDTLLITVCGNGFLYHMVRILAGTLLEAGKGTMPLEQIEQALRTGDRSLAGPTVSSVGLCLEEVRY